MDYLAGAATMLVLDGIYLSTVKGQWQAMVQKIQGSAMQVRMVSAIGVYVLMMFAVYYFIIQPKRSVRDAALLGLVVYGVFDLTNYALFKNYSFMMSIVDMAWGSFLFAVTAYIGKMFSK
jgi:uncharacterized membrane protein